MILVIMIVGNWDAYRKGSGLGADLLGERGVTDESCDETSLGRSSLVDAAYPRQARMDAVQRLKEGKVKSLGNLRRAGVQGD